MRNDARHNEMDALPRTSHTFHPLWMVEPHSGHLYAIRVVISRQFSPFLSRASSRWQQVNP